MTTRHQQTDVHESITKQDKNNINDPPKKHRLGTTSEKVTTSQLDITNESQGVSPFPAGDHNTSTSCLVPEGKTARLLQAQLRNTLPVLTII